MIVKAILYVLVLLWNLDCRRKGITEMSNIAFPIEEEEV